jgi:hypothetical protein
MEDRFIFLILGFMRYSIVTDGPQPIPTWSIYQSCKISDIIKKTVLMYFVFPVSPLPCLVIVLQPSPHCDKFRCFFCKRNYLFVKIY